jgi:hypothetical protein
MTAAALLAVFTPAACTEPNSDDGRGAGDGAPIPTECDASKGVNVVPDDDGIYFSAYPHAVAPDGRPASGPAQRRLIDRFSRLAGKRLALVYLLHPLLGGAIEFPAEQVRAIWDEGAVPLISMLPLSDWSLFGSGKPDPLLSMQRFADGTFDAELRRWALDAKATGIPLVVIFGQEVTAGWPWSGEFNGAGRLDGYGDPTLPDGPERFRDAYRRVVDVFREAEAHNVTWLYWTSIPYVLGQEKHYDFKAMWWNVDRYYYPGDNYVDWVGGGAPGYFPQGGYLEWLRFRPTMDVMYSFLTDFAPDKPQLIELAVAHNPRKGDMAGWITRAYSQLASGRWPNVKIVNWWHQYVPGSTSAIDVAPDVTVAFSKAVSDPMFLSRVTVECG